MKLCGKNLGFTLIEIVLVTGLVAVIGVIAAQFMVNFFDSYQKSENTARVERAGRDLLRTFETEVRGAQMVNLVSSTEIRITNQSSEVWSLRLINKNCATEGNNFVSFSQESGGVFLEEPLTPTDSLGGVNVTHLQFVETGGSITLAATLTSACGLPDTARFKVSASFNAEVRPRSVYND